MSPQKRSIPRREFLAVTGAVAVSSATGRGLSFEAARRPKVAAIFTELRHRSHAYNILMNLMGTCLFRGKRVDPGVDVVAWYADQFPANDMAREASKRLSVPMFDTIDKALCLGGKNLAVDAVLLIGEHGEYPTNELGQKMYPRKEFFDQIVKTMQRSQRFVPIFNDKHLSYRWDWAKQMYDEAQRLGIPLMAGSSVPLAERRPPTEVPGDARVIEAVAIHGGGREVYDFHGLEVLQSMIEARRGGETGISRVEFLADAAYEKAKQEGRWSIDLATAAMTAERDSGMKRQDRPVAGIGGTPTTKPEGDHALLVTYKDGTRGAVLKVGSSSDRWNFACRLENQAEPLATAFYNGPWGNLNLFSALSHAIAHFFRTGKSPSPVERTLLCSGALDAAMHSYQANGKPVTTPELEFGYRSQDFRAFREIGESWRVVTKDTPQPKTFAPY
ncbi:MAG: hypothetical protein JWM11_4847 [Planctomycetaceae bacterium]|nr:hypothetical protein [Planctomycetaceae bacterium]